MLTYTTKMFTINLNVLNDILEYFSNFDFEYGGVLGIHKRQVKSFIPVKNVSKNKKCFKPSFAQMNDALKQFLKDDLTFGGIVHSHTVGVFGSGVCTPSKEDMAFFTSFLQENPEFKFVLCPIVTVSNNQKQVFWYIFKNGRIKQINVKVI